jgi:hypothetical protein
MLKLIIRFFYFLFCLTGPVFGIKVATLPDINRPDRILVNKDKIYIIEKATIRIYSSENFKFIGAFGKEGEGPGEIKGRIGGIHFRDDHIVIPNTGRISYFTRDGKFIKENKMLSTLRWDEGSSIAPIGDGFVGCGQRRDRNAGKNYLTLNLYDPGLKKIKEFYHTEDIYRKGKIFVFAAPETNQFLVCDKRIFAAFGKDFIIEVYDNRGEKLFTIKNDKYEKLKITGKHIEAVHTCLKTDPRTKRSYEIRKKQLVFPDYLPAIRDFHADDKKIYIRTYKKKDGKTEFYIYNTGGKLLKKVFVPFIEKDGFEWLNYKLLYTIGNEKIYQLVDNIEIEQWELHVHDIK